MLFIVYFGLTLPETFYFDLFDRLDLLGPNICIYENCYLLDSRMTAWGIRQFLIGYLSQNDTMVISRMQWHYCAGKLPPVLKKFVSRHLGPKPTEDRFHSKPSKF